ncbi:MAG: hypothetical protein PXZ07_07215 [Candidatus Eremiobacteraeota bacterium]|nr:hypothetical protein [Candidatus Eremiobacteraeota bacterium]
MGTDRLQLHRESLAELARKYLWWRSPEAAMRSPNRVIAQVLEMGDFDDVQRAIETFGERALIDVVECAEPGWLSPKSWAYWHYRLRLTPYDRTPPPAPRRVL